MDFTTAEEQAVMNYTSRQWGREDSDRSVGEKNESESALNELWGSIHPLISYTVAADLSVLRRQERLKPFLSTNEYLRIYTLVHDYMTKNSFGGTAITKGARLYGRIEYFMRMCIDDLINSSELTDALNILRFVENRLYQVSDSPALKPLQYLDVNFVRKSQDEGRLIFQSRDLLSQLTKTYFVPRVEMKIAKATCSLTLTQPSLLLFSTHFIRTIMLSHLDVDEVSALERRTTKRPVYCCTSVLEQFASRTSISNRFPAIHRWSIQVGAQDHYTTTGIQGPDRQMAEAETGQRLLILELERDGREIKYRMTYGPRQSASEHFLGYTMYSNRDIESFANDVIGSMRADYHVARNNCQVFCKSLANCILIPRTGKEIFYGERELPGPARKRALHYRFWDYVLATEKDEMSPQSIPLSAQALSSGAIDILSAYALASSYNKDQKMIFCMWLAMLGLIGWNSDVGPFRHLYITMRNQEENLERLYNIAYQTKIDGGRRLLTEA